MNHYELLAILNGKYADTEVGAALKKLEELFAKQECVIHYTQNLERKKLAFPINNQTHGTYVLIEFDCEGVKLASLDRDFRLSHDVVRHTIVKRKKVGSPKVLLQDKKEDVRNVKVKDIDALITPMIEQSEQALSPSKEVASHTPENIEPAPKTDEVVLQEEKKQEEKPTVQEEEKEVDTTSKKKKTTKTKSLDERLDEILRNDIL